MNINNEVDKLYNNLLINAKKDNDRFLYIYDCNGMDNTFIDKFGNTYVYAGKALFKTPNEALNHFNEMVKSLYSYNKIPNLETKKMYKVKIPIKNLIVSCEIFNAYWCDHEIPTYL